jgi:Ser/Thr protein kinase RdoA (MazF antagonist)
VALIDLEDVAIGPAAADLGHVLAGLLCERAAGALPTAAEPRLARALLRGYAEVAPPPPPEALAWHTAASVLGRRALTAVNRVREDDLGALAAYLTAAARCLAQGAGTAATRERSR